MADHPSSHEAGVPGLPSEVSERRQRVWIFHGEGAPFASGVFASKAEALDWVAEHGLSGAVTEYEVGGGCYDLAVARGGFRDSRPHHGSPGHVAAFSPGLDHVHVRDGSSDV
jgi:hypothetical protein